MNYLSLSAFLNFVGYFSVSVLLIAVFTRLYIWFTPYNEIEHMRQGYVAPSIALVGAMLGFTFPLLTMSFYGVNLIDFLVWSSIAMAIQLVVFEILYTFIPAKIQENNISVAVFFAGASVSTGAVNAFSLIPH